MLVAGYKYAPKKNLMRMTVILIINSCILPTSSSLGSRPTTHLLCAATHLGVLYMIQCKREGGADLGTYHIGCCDAQAEKYQA